MADDAEAVKLEASDSASPQYGTSGGDTAANEAPPTYDSLFGKLKQANTESQGPVDYAKKSISVLEGACGCCIAVFGILICCGLGVALPIAEIVIGAIYLHECPINYLIPIYLIVSGVFSFFAGGGSCLGRGSDWKKRLGKSDEGSDQEKGTKEKAGNCFSSLVSMFLLAWLICGTVWTVNARPLHTTVKFVNGTSGMVNPLYCQNTVFEFAFWLSIASWICAGTLVAVACLICCCMCCIRCCVKD